MITLENMSILIVDDVKTMRSIVRKMLKSLNIGRTMHMAENGLEGLKILHSTRIDLAIIDWKMPVMNGSELLESIRNDKDLRDIPVLIVTAESEKDIVLEVAEIEVDGYLIKPLTPAVLDDKIKTVIHQFNHPDTAAIHIRKSRYFEEKNEFSTAIEHMKHAIHLRPSASRLIRNLGLLCQKAGDEGTMVKCLQKAALVNPQDAMTRYLLGDLYWQKNDLIPAAQYYLEVISLTRKFSDKAIHLGEELLENNYAQLAKKIFSKLIFTSAKDLITRDKIIEICMENGELEYSKTLLKKFIKEYPSNYDMIYKLGVVYSGLGDADKALECFFLVDKHHGFRLDVKLKIAKILFNKDKIIQADNYLNIVLRIDPKNEEALTLRQLL